MSNVAVAMNDDDVLSYTQGVRRAIVEAKIAEGVEKLDAKDTTVLLSALADMDRQSLSKKKIQSDNNNAEADRLAQQVIAKTFAHLGNRSPFAVAVGEQTTKAVPFEAPDVIVGEFIELDGEAEIGLADETYSDFMKRTASKRQ